MKQRKAIFSIHRKGEGELLVCRLSSKAQECYNGTDNIVVLADSRSDNENIWVSFDHGHTFEEYTFDKLEESLESLQAETDEYTDWLDFEETEDEDMCDSENLSDVYSQIDIEDKKALAAIPSYAETFSAWKPLKERIGSTWRDFHKLILMARNDTDICSERARRAPMSFSQIKNNND